MLGNPYEFRFQSSSGRKVGGDRLHPFDPVRQRVGDPDGDVVGVLRIGWGNTLPAVRCAPGNEGCRQPSCSEDADLGAASGSFHLGGPALEVPLGLKAPGSRPKPAAFGTNTSRLSPGKADVSSGP